MTPKEHATSLGQQYQEAKGKLDGIFKNFSAAFHQTLEGVPSYAPEVQDSNAFPFSFLGKSFRISLTIDGQQTEHFGRLAICQGDKTFFNAKVKPNGIIEYQGRLIDIATLTPQVIAQFVGNV